MDKYLLGFIATVVLLSATLYIIPIQDAESLLAIPPQRAFSFIFGPGGLNITAPLTGSNFTITGGDVTFFPNNFTINLGPNATALFEQLNQTISGLNGSSIILLEGDQIDLTSIGNATEISLEDCIQDEFLLYDSGSWSCVDVATLNGTGTGGNGTTTSIIQLDDVYFNAEEGTADDLTGLDCVNDVTYNFFDNTDPNEYARQVIQFCPDADIDDNVSWFYIVPQQYNSSEPVDFDFRLFWTDDDSGGGAVPGSYTAVATNDCEEDVSSGTGDCGSSDLELHDTGGTDGIVGVRFTTVTVPIGATITGATLQFHVDETSSGTLEVTFHGEDEDDSAPFDGTVNDLSGRTKTFADVDWVVPSWPTIHDEGAAQLSPDLSIIIQEIVDRGGWASGNDISLFIDGWPDNTGTRHAESQNGEAGNQPELNIDFTTGGGSGDDVCFEFSLMTLVDDDIMDGAFSAFETICVARNGLDELTITDFSIEATDHLFEAGDLVWLKIVRPNDFVGNDYEGDVFLFGSELKWQN